MFLQQGKYNYYEVELGFYKEVQLNEELVPQEDSVRVTVADIIATEDILVETTSGVRAVKANTISRFEKEGDSFYSIKVIKGSGKIYINMGVSGLSKEKAKAFALEKSN